MLVLEIMKKFNLDWIQLGILIATFISVMLLQNDYRPYLTLKDTQLNPTFDLEDVIKNNKGFPKDEYKITAKLTNEGRVPAVFVVTEKSADYQGIVWSPLEPENGIIFPGQEINLGWFLGWDRATSTYFEWLNKRIENGNSLWFEPNNATIRIDYKKIGWFSLKFNRYTTIRFELVRYDLNPYRVIGTLKPKIIDAN